MPRLVMSHTPRHPWHPHPPRVGARLQPSRDTAAVPLPRASSPARALSLNFVSTTLASLLLFPGCSFAFFKTH